MSTTITAILKVKNKMSPELLKVSKDFQKFTESMRKVSKESAKMASKFKQSISEMVKKAAKLPKLSAKIKNISKGLKNTKKSKETGEKAPATKKESSGGGSNVLGKVAKMSSVAKDGAIALIKQSDAYSNIQTRIKAITGGQEAAAALNGKIFQSADKARVNYEDMASTVCNLGAIAGDSFKNNDEMVHFSELLTKSFKIGGASAEEQSNAIDLVTQAMGAGNLQGDEFISIMNGAPQLAQAIAKEMNMPVEKLKEMGSEGKISSDKIKNALFNSADQINANFSQMPMTFGEAVTQIKSHITDKLRPAFEQLSTWLNSEKGQEALTLIRQGIDSLISTLPNIGTVLITVFNTVKQIFDFVMKNQTILIFVGTFILTLFTLVQAVLRVKMVFDALQKVGFLLNGVLRLSPFGMIALAIAALIAIGILLWQNWDVIKEKAEALWNTISTFFGGIGTAIGDAFTTAIGTVTEFFDWIGGKLNDLAETVKSLPVIGLLFSGSNDMNTKGEAEGLIGNALGTSYWRGGLTYINERGGEIIDLPNGSRVIPADKSQKLLGGMMNHITININGVGKSTGEIMSELVPQLKLTMANM